MKKLNAKHAKRCAAALICGLVIMLTGCLIIPDTLFGWKIGCIILGASVALITAAYSLILFRCPHCGRGKVSPLWFREYHCPVCGEKIQWE